MVYYTDQLFGIELSYRWKVGRMLARIQPVEVPAPEMQREVRHSPLVGQLHLRVNKQQDQECARAAVSSYTVRPNDRVGDGSPSSNMYTFTHSSLCEQEYQQRLMRPFRSGY